MMDQPILILNTDIVQGYFQAVRWRKYSHTYSIFKLVESVLTVFEKEVGSKERVRDTTFEALLLPFKERQAIDLLKSGKYEKVSFEGKGEKRTDY